MKGRESTPHIGIFGRCNAGKSTLLNFITGADTAIVSPVGGTTTDPVRKSYEILDFSPVILIDTAGVDDPTALGAERTSRTEEAARSVDLALLVFREWSAPEQQLCEMFLREDIPFVSIRNVDGLHPDLLADLALDLLHATPAEHTALLELIKQHLPAHALGAVRMFAGMLHAGDRVILVCPIDGGAPSGRMILPQVQALREALDAHAQVLFVQPAELPDLLYTGLIPRIIVTDSQVYKEVRELTPQAFEVTTFSILLAAAKGDMPLYKKGLETVDTLRDGDRILIAEFCSHQTSCDDIARVKLPAWLQTYTGRRLQFSYLAPTDPMPADAQDYALMLMCGGCMATPARIRRRIVQARRLSLPVTNFGLLIKKIR